MIFDKLEEDRHYMTKDGELVGPLVKLEYDLPIFSGTSGYWDIFGVARTYGRSPLVEVVPLFDGWEPTMEYRIPTMMDEAYVDAGSYNQAPECQNGKVRCYGFSAGEIGIIKPQRQQYQNVPDGLNTLVFEGKRVIMRSIHQPDQASIPASISSIWDVI